VQRIISARQSDSVLSFIGMTENHRKSQSQVATYAIAIDALRICTITVVTPDAGSLSGILS
jgi:hypothetical protein